MRKPPNAVKNAQPNSSSCICFFQIKDPQACSSDRLGKDPFRSVTGQKVESRVLNTWRVVRCAKMSLSEVRTAVQGHLANFQEFHCSCLQWPLGSVLQHWFSHKDREGWGFALNVTRYVDLPFQTALCTSSKPISDWQRWT